MSSVATVPDPEADRESAIRFLLRFTSRVSEQARARAEVARVKQATKTYVKTQLPRVLLFAGIGFLVSFLLNVYLMRGKYQGYFVPEKVPASGEGNVVVGSLYYLVGSAVVFGLVGYRLKHGKHAFSKGVGRFPDKVKELVEADRRDLAVHLLWGLAGSLLVVLVLGPSLTGLVGIGLVVALGTVFRRLVTGLLMIGWRWTVARIAPRYAAPPTAPVTAVTSLAMVAAMLVGWVVHGSGLRLALAVAAGVAAYLVGKRSAASVAAAVLLVPVAFFTVLTLVPGTASADDGGEAECSGDFLGCPGADDLLGYATLGGLAGAIGAAAGEAAGEATGEDDDDGGGGGGGEPPCGPEEAARTIEAWKNYQKAHPGGTWDDFMGGKIAQSRAEAMAVSQQLDEMSKEAQAIDDRLEAMEQSIKLASTPWKDLTPQQQHDVKKRVVTAYHRAHPEADAETINKMTGQFGKDPNLTGLDMIQYVAGESLLGLPGATWEAGKTTLGQLAAAPEFIKNTAAAWWEDAASGQQADRLGRIFLDPISALSARIQNEGGVSGVLADAKASGMNLTAAGAKQFDQAVRAFDHAVKTGDGKAIANAIDGVAGQMLSDYLLTAGAGKVMNLTRSGLEAAGLVKPLSKAEQVAAWSDQAKGIPLDTPEKRAAVGFSEDANKAFQEAVDTHDSTLQMQRRGADAVQHEGTAYMKPQGAKSMKSVGPMDAELGGPAKEGLLSFYKPVNPLAPAGSPVQQRYEMLQKLYDSVPGKDLAAKQAYITKEKLEVWVAGKKVKMDVKFDSEGVLRNSKDGKAIVSDYDGWAVLDKAGERRLGYAADGTRLKGPDLRADREKKIPMIRKLVDDGRTQLQHAPTSSEWGPIPAMLAGAEPTPCFDCKTLAIAENILKNMAKDGAVEFRPGAKSPFLTKAAGIADAKKPSLTLPGSKGAPPPSKSKTPFVPPPRPTGDGGKKK